jgi:hypothetical protein
MKTRIILSITTLILVAGLLAAPANAKPACGITFPIMLGVGY